MRNWSRRNWTIRTGTDCWTRIPIPSCWKTTSSRTRNWSWTTETSCCLSSSKRPTRSASCWSRSLTAIPTKTTKNCSPTRRCCSNWRTTPHTQTLRCPRCSTWHCLRCRRSRGLIRGRRCRSRYKRSPIQAGSPGLKSLQTRSHNRLNRRASVRWSHHRCQRRSDLWW